MISNYPDPVGVESEDMRASEESLPMELECKRRKEMSQEFNKKVEGNEVIFDNSEARWIFSSGRPPHVDDYQVAITVVDKKFHIPVMMIMSGREFRRMLLDMGIKTLREYNLTGLKSEDSELQSGLIDDPVEMTWDKCRPNKIKGTI